MAKANAERAGHRRWDVWTIVSLFAAPAGLATLAGFFGRLWWRFELACHFRVQYFVVLFVTALALLAGKRRRRAAAAGVLALVNLGLIVPLYFGGGNPHAGATTLRAVNLNLHTRNRRFEDVRRFLRETAPDFFVLEEVNANWLHELEPLKRDYPHIRARPREDNFGIALFSRIPFESAEIVTIGKAGVPSVVARIDVDGQSLTVVGIHPLPPAGGNGAAYRNEQMVAVADYVAKQPGPVLLLGDLNMTSWSPYFGDFLRASGLRDSRRGFGVQPTWPAGSPLLRIPIDHCLVSPQFSILDRRIGPDVGSDHLPVIVELAAAAR
jgi:endonuclease/exonuclease/phosphatase (EEP) superfamily protein YafD